MVKPRYFIIFLLITLFSFNSIGQLNPKVEVQGDLESSGKMSQAEKPTNPNDLVTKAHMDSVVINLGLMLDDGIQKLLDLGYTPKELLENGVQINSILNSTYGGGHIGYLEEDGTGLIVLGAFPTQQGLIWGCQGTDISTLESFGSGSRNSNNIAISCAQTNVAAKEAINFNYANFNDWFLPSKVELESIIASVGELYLPGIFNWTSSQVDDVEAFAYNTNTNQMEPIKKGSVAAVMVVRSF